MKKANIMAVNHKHIQEPRRRSAMCGVLLHWLVWLLLAGALFYGLHRYFEFRERQLDKRLERLK